VAHWHLTACLNPTTCLTQVTHSQCGAFEDLTAGHTGTWGLLSARVTANKAANKATPENMHGLKKKKDSLQEIHKQLRCSPVLR
jgi:hypothetical protein